MPEESKLRDAADAARGIVEAIPVYQDLVQPDAQGLGKELLIVPRAVHVALAPLRLVVWGF